MKASVGKPENTMGLLLDIGIVVSSICFKPFIGHCAASLVHFLLPDAGLRINTCLFKKA